MEYGRRWQRANGSNASYDSGTATFTLNRSGNYPTSAADAFRYIYLSVSGDCTITARVTSYTVTSSYARAGVMIRETPAAGATHVSYLYMKYSTRVYCQYRSTTDGTANGSMNVTVTALPYWVRMVRSGSTFQCFRSPDGQTWTQLGSPGVTISMTDPVYIGLAGTSAVSSLKTFTFDNSSISQP